MNAAWSNSEQWTEAIPEIFKQPMTIAFGGAVLAHAIFFLGLPVVAGKDNQPNIADTPLVELRPQDLSQIPPNVTQANQIPPNFTQSKLPTGTLLPGSTGLLSPSIPPPFMSPLDSATTSPWSNFGGGSSSSVSTYSNSGSSTEEEERKKPEQERARKAAAQQLEEQKLADAQRANKPIAALPSTTPTPPGGETEKPVSATPSPTVAPSPTVMPSPTITPSPTAMSPSSIAGNPIYTFDSKKTGPTIGDGNLKGAATKPDSKENEIYKRNPSQRPQQFPVDTPTKTLPYPVQVDKKPVAVIPDYAQKVKDGKETDGKVIVGIALDGQGKLVSDPSIIQSTGYPVLDAYAIEYVKSRKFRVTYRSGLFFMVIPIDPPISKPVS